MTLADRLLRRLEPVPIAGCWLWTGAVLPNGYGYIGLGNSRAGYTHRVAYAEFVAPIPAGMNVLHRCDVPCCCNPAHLFVGTQQENVADMMRKGRHRKAADYNNRRGERHGNAKLTDAKVRAIRADTRAAPAVARDIGVSTSLVCQVRAGRIWKHVV